MRALIVAAAVCGLALSILGAYGAHQMAPSASEAAFGSVEDILKDVIPFDEAAWSSAMLYGFAHSLAALLVVALPVRGRVAAAAGWAFVAGVVLFSFSIMLKEILLSEFLPASGGDDAIRAYDRVTMVTPLGGIAFMAGWVLLGLAAVLRRREA